MYKTSQSQKGFTLIELLVVIAIVGMLSSIVLAALNNARAKSRDAARVHAIKQIQTALALYRDQYEVYPAAQLVNDCGGFATLDQTLQPLVAEGYLPELPSVQPGNLPVCFMYTYPNTYIQNDCGSDASSYVLLFGTEVTELAYPTSSIIPTMYCVSG